MTTKPLTDEELKTRLLLALAYLDDVIAAYGQEGIIPLMNACRAAKEWRKEVDPPADQGKEGK